LGVLKFRHAQTPYIWRGVQGDKIEFYRNLHFSAKKPILYIMDAGEIVFIVSRLSTGALAAFFAIMLWSKTRDIAWMLIVIGTIAAYIETVYSILALFGITGNQLSIGSVPIAAILLPNLRTAFFIAAFLVMIIRKFRRY
jgi:hypothetical protein